MSAPERDEHAIWDSRWRGRRVRVCRGGAVGICTGIDLSMGGPTLYQVTYDDGTRGKYERRFVRLARP